MELLTKKKQLGFFYDAAQGGREGRVERGNCSKSGGNLVVLES